MLGSSSARRLGTRQDFRVGKPQRASPFARIDQQRQVKREARLPCIEVPDLPGVCMPELAVRRVVDREHERRTVRSFRGAKRVSVEQPLERDAVIAEQPIRTLKLRVCDHRVR